MSKKSTIALSVMACLLAVAVATTIVLAAFSANKTATTTVQFANGVQIKINGAYTDTSGSADVISRTAVNLLWACTEGSQTKNTSDGSMTDVSSAVVFDAISFTNGDSSESSICYLIAKPSISCTAPASPSQEQTAAATSAFNTAIAGASAWTAIGATGWYAYSTDTTNITVSSTSLPSGTTMTPLALEATANFLSSTTLTSTPIDNLAGATFTATIEVYAVNAAAADAIAALSSSSGCR